MTLTDILAQMDTLLSRITEDPDGDRIDEVGAYLDLCYQTDTARRAGLAVDDATALDAFLTRTAPDIETVAATFDADGGEAVRLFMQQEFVGDDWVTLCLRRSHIEAFNDLYRPHMPAAALIDTSELDDNIRNKARMEALPIPEQTPSDLPDSHWWWQLP
jgi:hypothetical protein